MRKILFGIVAALTMAAGFAALNPAPASAQIRVEVGPDRGRVVDRRRGPDRRVVIDRRDRHHSRRAPRRVQVCRNEWRGGRRIQVCRMTYR